MSALEQYASLVGVVLAVAGFVAVLYLAAGKTGGQVQREPAKNDPAGAGVHVQQPAWLRYHIRYYGYALLFLAFDMEMAFMYPWAVVYVEEGLKALLDMGVFLAILFLGLLYGWSQGALKRQ